MYTRNQLIFAQKKLNESGEFNEQKTDLDTAIEQIDYLLSFINKNN
ncbi:hypothetical protein [Seonamhaeicola sp.]